MNKLLEYGVNIDTQNKFGHTAFTSAAAAGNSEMARMLLFNGADAYHMYVCMYTMLLCVCVYLPTYIGTYVATSSAMYVCG